MKTNHQKLDDLNYGLGICSTQSQEHAQKLDKGQVSNPSNYDYDEVFFVYILALTLSQKKTQNNYTDCTAFKFSLSSIWIGQY